jgi:hypothetical protein
VFWRIAVVRNIFGEITLPNEAGEVVTRHSL